MSLIQALMLESTYSYPLGHCRWMPVTCTVSASTVEYPLGWCMGWYSQEDRNIVSVPSLCTIQQSEIAVLQVEALCALKRHQEAAETLNTIAQHDRAFSKSKDFKFLLKQVQAVA